MIKHHIYALLCLLIMMHPAVSNDNVNTTIKLAETNLFEKYNSHISRKDIWFMLMISENSKMINVYLVPTNIIGRVNFGQALVAVCDRSNTNVSVISEERYCQVALSTNSILSKGCFPKGKELPFIIEGDIHPEDMLYIVDMVRDMIEKGLTIEEYVSLDEKKKREYNGPVIYDEEERNNLIITKIQGYVDKMIVTVNSSFEPMTGMFLVYTFMKKNNIWVLISKKTGVR